MSENSLKRFLKHRTKKERGQSKARKGFGLLEKHKDYRLRAKDFHKKRERIRELQAKAALRNPDEFNTAMTHSSIVDGKLYKDTRRKYTTKNHRRENIVDSKFLAQKAQQERKKTERLESSLASLDATETVKRNHVIFVDEEDDARDFDAVKHFNTVPALLKKSHNRLTVDQLEDNVVVNKTLPGMFKNADKAREQAYRELEEHRETLERVQKVQKKVQLQKHLMDKGRRKKIAKYDRFGNEIKSKTIYKWKQERKR